ncbi:MAG: prepilin-type N-terminal cleavage/methylation domain-containing protein [Pseudomonadota bacterium]
MSGAASDRDGERGFTMIEAVVALALVMVVLGAIGSVVATNVRGVSKLEQRVGLVDAARLVISGMPRGEAVGGRRGEILGHRWQIATSPFVGGAGVAGSRFVPERVEVRLQSPSGAMLSLETVRLRTRDGE